MNNLSQKIFINSKFIKSKSKKFLIVENPSTLKTLGKISIENKTGINKTIKILKQEQKKWSNLSQLDRPNFCMKLLTILKKNL